MSRISKRRARRAGMKKRFSLQLTSLMDALMIIVVFLLKSYGISSMGVHYTDHLELPVSKAPDVYGEGLVMVVARDKIYVDDQVVMEFAGNPEEKKYALPEGSIDQYNRILPLFDALDEKRQNFELLASRSENPEENAKEWTGEIMMQVDKFVPYELLRKVMYTAGMAGYRKFRLTVQKLAE